jgi:hypothetical protein
MSPQTRHRNDYKPPSTNIKNRLALRSRIASSNNTRILRTGVNKILRRTDLRSGLVSKRPTNINRAKDYARKIRQARLKLNEGGSSSSTRLKSSIEVRSPKKDSEETQRKNDDNEDDYLAIANDVDFDEDENDESTGGKNASIKDEAKTKTRTKQKEEEDGNDGNEAIQEEKKVSKESAKDEDDEKKSFHENKSISRSRTPSKERVRKFERIEYSCIHCGKRSTSAQVSRLKNCSKIHSKYLLLLLFHF